eukprot:scaffold20780_cov57-Phaeocystis_antarctica.AAC.3
MGKVPPSRAAACSAPVPPQGTPGGSGWLGGSKQRPALWATWSARRLPVPPLAAWRLRRGSVLPERGRPSGRPTTTWSACRLPAPPLAV